MRRSLWWAPLLVIACRHSGSERIVGTGTIEVREVEVAPQVPARVVRVWLDEGESVHAGDTLVVLTQSTTRADLAQGEARLRRGGSRAGQARPRADPPPRRHRHREPPVPRRCGGRCRVYRRPTGRGATRPRAAP